MARIRLGAIASSRTALTKRSTSTEVLPLPAAADSASGSARRAIAARAKILTGERLIEASCNPQPQQLLDGAHVERHLQAAVLDPPRPRWCATALVVIEHGLAPWAHVNAVDPPPQLDSAGQLDH